MGKAKEIKRKLRRVKEELMATCEIARYTDAMQAFNTLRAKLDIQIMCRNGFKEPENVKNRLLRKHQTMLSYLSKRFRDYWADYKKPHLEDTDPKFRNKVWICWWQGLENAPEIVKKCVNSIKNNSGKHEVVIITLDNYAEYVDFPPHILEKVKKGIINKTFFSDLLRLNLLSRYGGTWIDSTIFACGNIEKYLDYDLWSIKRPDYKHASVAAGSFAVYAIGCSYQSRWIFQVILDFLYNYWDNYSYVTDYLIFHYGIVMSQQKFPEIKDLFQSIIPNNPNCDELHTVLSKPYDQQLWSKIKENTVLFKLSWKSRHPKEINGTTTFYGMLMNGSLK